MPATWLSLLLAALLFPLGLTLPAWCSWENGPIENLQVAVLVTGAVVSFVMARCQEDRQMRNFYLWLIPVWLLLAARELSWGRVFFAPVSIGASGPVFPPLRSVWYGHYVYPVNSVVILATLAGLWRSLKAGAVRQIRWPAIDALLLIVAAVVSQLVFERNLIVQLKPYSQMFEEWSELLAYWCLLSMVISGRRQQ